MALQTIQNITVDLHRSSYKSLFAKQYDKNTQIVNVTICDNGKALKDLTDYIFEVKILTPNNKYLKLSGEQYITIESNIVTIIFPGGVFVESGNVKIELVMLQNQKQLSTMSFNFVVESSVYSDEDILSDQEMLSVIEQYKKEFIDYTDLARKWAIGGDITFIGQLSNMRYYGYAGMFDKWRTEPSWLSNYKSPIDCKENDIISFEYKDECKIIEIAFLSEDKEFIKKLVFENTKTTGDIFVPAKAKICYFGFTIYDDMSYFPPEEAKSILIKKNNTYLIDIPSETNNSKYYAEESKRQAEISTEQSNTAIEASKDVKTWVVGENPPEQYDKPGDFNNGMYWTNQAKISEENAKDSENLSKQWAIGSYDKEYNGPIRKGKCLGFLSDFEWKYDEYSFYNVNYIPCKANDTIKIEYGNQMTICDEMSIYFYYGESVPVRKFNTIIDDREIITIAPEEFNDLDNKTGYFVFEIKPKENEIVDLDNIENIYITINGKPYVEVDIPSEINNSKYYAEKSKVAADYAAYTLEHAKDVIEITQAEYDKLSDEEKNNGYIYDIIDGFYEPELLSRRWAIGDSDDSRIPTDTNNSKYYALLAKIYSEIAKEFTPEGYQELIDRIENLTKSVYSDTEPFDQKEDDIWYQPY